MTRLLNNIRRCREGLAAKLARIFPLLAAFALLLTIAVPAAAVDWEWDPTWGYHREEWYDPSDWFGDDPGVDYEDYYYGDYYDDAYGYDDDWYDTYGYDQDYWYDTYDYGYDYYTDDWYDDDVGFDEWYDYDYYGEDDFGEDRFDFGAYRYEGDDWGMEDEFFEDDDWYEEEYYEDDWYEYDDAYRYGY